MTATCNNLEEILDDRHELDKGESNHQTTPVTTIEWRNGSPRRGICTTEQSQDTANARLRRMTGPQ